LLEDALKFLVDASSKGRILFVGAKRQAAEIVKEEAKRSGAYYINHRWPGGLLTNFKMMRRSLKKLEKLEESFEQGVEGRTKYEVSVMKKEWERLHRLYGGIKTMDRKPRAVVIIDAHYERNAVLECLSMGVPIVALVDTNTDPEGINYPVPGNDDATKSISLFLKLFADAVWQGNEGNGVVHDEKDYSHIDVQIVKSTEEEDETEEAKVVERVKADVADTVTVEKPRKAKKGEELETGLLGKSREAAQKSKTKKIEKTEVKKPKAKKEKTSKKDKDEKSLEDLDLSTRTVNALKKAKVSIEKLSKMAKEELEEIKGLGKKSAEEVFRALK
jgi:small subunit ribosomal protein S2